MKANDNDLVLACLHASTDLIQGLTGTITDGALKYRMKRIAGDLIHAVDVIETDEIEEELRM